MFFYTVLLEFFCLICSQDFKHEVNLLIKLRHPNIVQFLGAVTETKPLMLVTEFLRGVCILFHGSTIIFSRLFGICSCLVKCIFQGDLHQYLKEKGALSPLAAINFALDIARYFDPHVLSYSTNTISLSLHVPSACISDLTASHTTVTHSM